MKRLVLLDARASVRSVHGHPEVGDRVHVVDLYDLPSTDLAPHVGLVVTAWPTRRSSGPTRRSVARFLDDGKVVVFCGHLLRPWLPGCATLGPAPIVSFRDYAVRLTEARTIFAGVDADDLTFRPPGPPPRPPPTGTPDARRRHLAPARRVLPAPRADVFISTDDGATVLYIDEVTTPGTLVVTSLDPLSHFGSYFMPATERFLDGFLAWLAGHGDEETEAW